MLCREVRAAHTPDNFANQSGKRWAVGCSALPMQADRKKRAGKGSAKSRKFSENGSSSTSLLLAIKTIQNMEKSGKLWQRTSFVFFIKIIKNNFSPFVFIEFWKKIFYNKLCWINCLRRQNNGTNNSETQNKSGHQSFVVVWRLWLLLLLRRRRGRRIKLNDTKGKQHPPGCCFCFICFPGDLLK